MIVSVAIEDEAWSKVPDLEALAARTVNAVALIEQAGELECEVAILFAGDAEVAVMNKAWRGKPAATNVLSFPAPKGQPAPEGEPRFLGDIVLASGVVAKEAAEQGKSMIDHTAHLIVHGMMHVLGYDHRNDEEAEAMEAREIRILQTLGIPDPYAAVKML